MAAPTPGLRDTVTQKFSGLVDTVKGVPSAISSIPSKASQLFASTLSSAQPEQAVKIEEVNDENISMMERVRNVANNCRAMFRYYYTYSVATLRSWLAKLPIVGRFFVTEEMQFKAFKAAFMLQGPHVPNKPFLDNLKNFSEKTQLRVLGFVFATKNVTGKIIGSVFNHLHLDLREKIMTKVRELKALKDADETANFFCREFDDEEVRSAIFTAVNELLNDIQTKAKTN